MTIAALFVERDGIYASCADVELWDIRRDARRYPGPHKVIAHPPCARWSVLAPLVASQGGLTLGDDGGCFESALTNVERCGGVLEHPRLSYAWPAFGLDAPARGTWTRSRKGWVTEVSQAAYGHRAQKRTWLYLVGEPAPMNWRMVAGTHRVSDASDSNRGSIKPRLSKTECKATPPDFARALLRLVSGDEPRVRQMALAL